jgi:hypothetical protein
LSVVLQGDVRYFNDLPVGVEEEIGRHPFAVDRIVIKKNKVEVVSTKESVIPWKGTPLARIIHEPAPPGRLRY